MISYPLEFTIYVSDSRDSLESDMDITGFRLGAWNVAFQ